MTSNTMAQEDITLPLTIVAKAFLILEKDIEATCADGENWAWDGTTLTIGLDGQNSDFSNYTAIQIGTASNPFANETAKIAITNGTETTIETASSLATNYGIKIYGSAEFTSAEGLKSDAGVLTVKGGESLQANSYGIWATSDLTFSGPTVNGYGGLTHTRMAMSVGIYADSNFEIKSGDIYGQGGSTTLEADPNYGGMIMYISCGAGCGTPDSGDTKIKSTFKMSGGSYSGRSEKCLAGYYLGAGAAGSLSTFDIDTDLFELDMCTIEFNEAWGYCAYWTPDEPVEESEPAQFHLRNVLILLQGVENVAPTGESWE